MKKLQISPYITAPQIHLWSSPDRSCGVSLSGDRAIQKIKNTEKASQ